MSQQFFKRRKQMILLIGSSIRKGNSEKALKFAKIGIKEKGLKTETLLLNKYFLPDGSHKDLTEAIDQVRRADGIVWSTPVYFGAWTSLAQEFFEELQEKKVRLFPKVVGMISVGAKRNGGQETTITFASWDLMGLGACFVNDGYPISQFGGTCVAGPIGGLEHDEQGKRMCYNLGKRIAETVSILKAGTPTGEVQEIYFPLKGNFHRCKGCVTCPGNSKEDYKCRNTEDDMLRAHIAIMSADIITPIGYDARFHERTRYLRRDNYRLTYHVVNISEQRDIPLFLKQNAILARKNAEEYAKLIKSGRKKVNTETQIYEPIGH